MLLQVQTLVEIYNREAYSIDFNFIVIAFFIEIQVEIRPAVVAELSKALSNVHTSSILRSQVRIPLGAWSPYLFVIGNYKAPATLDV